MSFTPAQAQAIAARGNVLVVAGAGTGKTSTLVERCLDCLLNEKPPASLEEILMVTFTDAAAAEMRQRIRARLEEKLAGQPDDPRWPEQLALFETAHIGTLHSFCLQLVRQHFYELELDPQLAILAEEEAKLLADDTLAGIFESHYAGMTANAEAAQQLIQAQGRGWDLPIRALVLRLHHYTQTLRDPAGWFEAQLAMFQSAEPAQWRQWLLEGVAEWRDRWLPALQAAPPENKKAAECWMILKELPANPSREQSAATLENACLIYNNWPRGKVTAWRKPIEAFFAEAAFLRSLARNFPDVDPLAQDWNWVRSQMTTLLQLAREFTAAFSDAKRELGAVDFHDLEQHALRLLWGPDRQQPTAAAQQWRRKLRFVFVDEYQDINEAQDAILQALGRDGAGANRFLVGDVKQSIYRFRLADPRIFQNYAHIWSGDDGKVIPLVDNFRSREGILNLVNALFTDLMRNEIGGVAYGADARLQFGGVVKRAAGVADDGSTPGVELHLRLQSTEKNAAEDEGEAARAWTEVLNLEEAAKEARLTALRLREMKASGHAVWDGAAQTMRPVDWGDMAVLLRSPAGKAESYAREFTRLGVPLTVARGGFYESMEITDLLSLLLLLDNPLQDLPVLAVLHSPLVGMTLDELATIRLQLRKGHCWVALRRYHEICRDHSGWAKADRFLKNFAAWRRLARQMSLSRFLETVLEQTHYAAWLLTQARGEQRHANVRRLVSLAQQFDQFQRQGLFRFLRFIEAQRAAETEPRVAPVSGDNSVALMSIHQSKGLEFPVVVVADLGKSFNLSDLRAEIILDSQYGLCPQIKPPHTGQRYPSLPYWLARQRQKQEMLGEEMRLLYVAMTRARDTLILTGSVSEKKFSQQEAGMELTTALLLSARNYADWLMAWSGKLGAMDPLARTGENSWWRWTIYNDLDERLLNEPLLNEPSLDAAESSLDAAGWEKLRQRLQWQYPHAASVREQAKTTVTALRRRQADESADEAPAQFRFAIAEAKARIKAPARLAASEIGIAHHIFLQLISLEQVGSLEQLRGEARRLEAERALSSEEIAHLDFVALADFWQSALGQQILAQKQYVRRELPFTARFSLAELPGKISPAPAPEEFIVVQGAADLAVLLPNEIWLVDFKTDRMAGRELEEKVKLYRPQLQIYARALERIHQRPVNQLHLHFLALRRSVPLSERNDLEGIE